MSLDQLTKVLAALGGTLHLHSADVAAPQKPKIAAPVQAVQPKALAAPAKKASGPPPARSTQVIGTPAARRNPTGAAKPAPRSGVVVRPKKGTW